MKITQLPAEMITEIAMGLHSPAAVATKYGYSIPEFMEMSTYAWFHRQLDDAKKKMAAEGYTFKSKMAAMAEDLLTDAYQAAVKSPSAETKLDVAKYLTKVAGLEPVAGQVAAGGGFSLVINIPASQSQPAQQMTIDAAPTLPPSLGQIEDAQILDDLPAPPTHTLGRDMSNKDLAYDDSI